MSTASKFHIPDMTCNHCVQTLAKAIQSIAPNATVTADLTSHQLTINNSGEDLHSLENAIKQAGFTSQQL